LFSIYLVSIYALATRTIKNQKLPKELSKKLGEQLINDWMQLQYLFRVKASGFSNQVCGSGLTTIRIPNLGKSGSGSTKPFNLDPMRIRILIHNRTFDEKFFLSL
jgi:hypothetical protein